MMKKLFFIIVLFYSNLTFSADTKLPSSFGFQAYLVCENISSKDEGKVNRYYILDADKIMLLKTWVNSFKINNKEGFRHFNNEPKAIRKIIDENEHHIFFEKAELDKIKGIFSIKTKNGDHLNFKCTIINKDSFFLSN